MTNQPPPATKTCPRCGHPFTCGGNACWCAAVALSPDQRANLRRQFIDCLCPHCLQQIAAAAQSSQQQ